jgi:hypothetical protein
MWAIEWIDVHPRGKNAGSWECIETGSLRTGSSGDCARPNLAPSLDIHETAATEKMAHLSGEGAVRRAWGGGYSTSVCFEFAKIEEVVRE